MTRLRRLVARWLRRAASPLREEVEGAAYAEDLEEFLAADGKPTQGDAAFRERLRERLWREYIEK